ncbi:transforming acidic coiled-coil-containing protein 1-like [Centruroides vittatus]|uniref:transforming acidic coiled-coil-containing protein 1-like n=1 Tax=Centruroides vittatus TaxID=120091 RepID=UPI00350F66C4
MKNKSRLTNNKKINSLGSSPNKEYSNGSLIWSKESEKTKNAGGEKCPENKIMVDTNPTEKIENPHDTKENNSDKQEIKECEVKEYEKDEKNLNVKQSSTCKLQEEKECNTSCDWSNERNELFYQLKNLNQTQKITRFIVKELINLISLWMEDSRRENMELKECKQKLIFERDQAIEDLRSVENAFSDLHRRYEKSKTMIEEFKENENRLKQQITEGTEKLAQQKEMYKLLKKRSEERIEEANAEIINIEKSKETEIAVLKAQLRKAEMKANSLEKSLEQKIRENTELSSICEDLIAKVSKK